MNELNKTGLFWVAAAAMLGIGTFLAWPTAPPNDEGGSIGQPLFEKFTDPLAAASMKLTTYDAEQAKLT
ncbi:MAG: hypothetical protein AAF989_13715, partial [Planctomycetota bacterium]